MPEFVAVPGVTGQATAEESFTTTISFYAGFDLTSGMTEIDPTVLTLIIGDGQEIEAIAAPQIDPLFEFSPEIDLYFGFSADADRPLTVVAEQIKGMTVLADTEFEAVTQSMLKTLDMPAVTEVIIDQDDLVVLLMQDDQYVLLGSVQQLPGVQVQFTYQTISGGSGGEPGEVPEPGTWLLLGGGVLGLVRLLRRKHPSTLTKGEKCMQRVTRVLAVLVVLSCWTGIAVSAELAVIRVGLGNGDVIGEDIDCGPFCEATYPVNTVVHLQAIPEEGSTFEGWMVNGVPHQGVIPIAQEDILVTATFSGPPLDDSTVMWYDGNRKMYHTIALDQLIVYPAFPRDPVQASAVDYDGFLREVADCVHPQARIADGYLIRVTSPEPLTLAQLTESIAALRRLKYVRQVSPILYSQFVVFDSGERPLSILTGKITVTFPKRYTEEQIQATEQDYGLQRIEYEKAEPLSWYHYRVDGDALHAVMVANQLYESGLVEQATPGTLVEAMVGQGEPTPPNDPSLPTPWHLQWGIGNMTTVWQNYQGEGSVIAILDDGID